VLIKRKAETGDFYVFLAWKCIEESHIFNYE